jgi:DNA mismatch repair protein MutS2
MPELDLHGEDRIGASIKVNHFIDDNYNMGIDEIAIIHGIGSGILKKEVLKVLKNNKKVIEYNVDCFNDGCTLVKLTKKVDLKSNMCYNTTHN